MEFFISKTKIFRAISLGLLLTLASLLLFIGYLNFFGIIFGVIGLLLFGSVTLFFILRLFQTESQVIINLKGIEDKRLNTGLIQWEKIDAVLLEKYKQAQCLVLVLYSPEKYYYKLPKFQLFLRKLNGQKGMNNLRIRFSDLDKPIDEAWEFIEKNVIKNREIDLPLAP